MKPIHIEKTIRSVNKEELEANRKVFLQKTPLLDVIWSNMQYSTLTYKKLKERKPKPKPRTSGNNQATMRKLGIRNSNQSSMSAKFRKEALRYKEVQSSVTGSDSPLQILTFKGHSKNEKASRMDCTTEHKDIHLFVHFFLFITPNRWQPIIGTSPSSVSTSSIHIVNSFDY